jgi:2-C-methyl-D-erythritol 2,4-cyclodiphosphate synthase
MRIGIGYDIHRLVDGRKCVIGGVDIPYEKGLLGHSDADVLLHAICDALLGACGESDIGVHFPDNDVKFKDMSSLKLLKKVYDLLTTKGYKIINIDAVVIAEEPKLKKYIPEMKKNISEVLNILVEDIGIKATTNEKLGSIGRGEGIAAQAVAGIEKISL